MKLRRAVASLTATLTVCALAIVGFAEPASAGLPGVARGGIAVYEVREFGRLVAFDVCASGRVDDGPNVEEGAWAFTVDGWRSNNSTILHHPAFTFGLSFSGCFRLHKQWTGTGYATANVSYVLGVGVDMVTYGTALISWDLLNEGDWVTFGVGNGDQPVIETSDPTTP